MTTSGGGPVERMLGGPPGGGSDTVVAESADAAGLRNAFLTHGVELYGYARRSLGDPAAAEDVVQETFVRAWRAATASTAGSARCAHGCSPSPDAW